MRVALKCKRCGGRVFEEDPYFENGERWQELQCILCSRSFYLTMKDWNRQKDKMKDIVRGRKALRKIEEGAVLSAPEWGLG